MREPFLIFAALLFGQSATSALAGDRTMPLKEGDAAYYQGDIPRSLNLYEKAARENPGDFAAFQSLGG